MTQEADPGDTDDPGAEWRRVIDAALEANEGSKRPTTLAETARALAALKIGSQKWQSWQTWLKRLRRTGVSSERNIRLLAKVLGVPRRDLPYASEQVTKELLWSRLRSLEGDFDDFVRATTERLAALEEGQGFQAHG